MKKGKEYELLIKDIYEQLAGDAIVTHDDKIFDKSSESLRQIDVSIRHKLADIDYLTIIEVKDYGHKAGVGIVEAFARVIEDVSANKGIIICSRGFSRHAIAKARNLGIELLTFHSAKNKNWETIVKTIVHRNTYYFDVDFEYQTEMVPASAGETFKIEEFLSYNKRDLISSHDVIFKEIISKNSLRDLSRKVNVINIKDIELYGIINNKPIRMSEGFFSARFVRGREELFYIDPIDYLIKNDHIKNQINIQNVTWDYDTLEQLLTRKVSADKNIIGKPDIEISSYVFSDGTFSGSFKFNVSGGIKGEMVKKGSQIANYNDVTKRVIELERLLSSE